MTSARYIIAPVASASIILVAGLTSVVIYKAYHAMDRYEDKAYCRTVALQAVEFGAAASSLSAIRDACIHQSRKR